jgi:hypothetical protein
VRSRWFERKSAKTGLVAGCRHLAFRAVFQIVEANSVPPDRKRVHCGWPAPHR